MSKSAYSVWQRYVFQNLGLKLVSLGLAVGLWLAVAREPVSEVALDVPIAFRNMPGNLEISSENIPKAQIRLRGPERVIRRLQPADVYVELWLDGVRAGERTFDLTSREVHQPHELQVVQVIPSQVHLAFDLRQTKQVPVQPRVTGSFVEGYQIGQIQVEPAVVTIVGPAKQVAAVDSATTDPVDITGTIDRVTHLRHAYVSDPLIQVTNAAPVRVTVIMQRGGAKDGN
jgi:YbbR domain-containing protein